MKLSRKLDHDLQMFAKKAGGAKQVLEQLREAHGSDLPSDIPVRGKGIYWDSALKKGSFLNLLYGVARKHPKILKTLHSLVKQPAITSTDIRRVVGVTSKTGVTAAQKLALRLMKPEDATEADLRDFFRVVRVKPPKEGLREAVERFQDEQTPSMLEKRALEFSRPLGTISPEITKLVKEEMRRENSVLSHIAGAMDAARVKLKEAIPSLHSGKRQMAQMVLKQIDSFRSNKPGSFPVAASTFPRDTRNSNNVAKALGAISAAGAVYGLYSRFSDPAFRQTWEKNKSDGIWKFIKNYFLDKIPKPELAEIKKYVEGQPNPNKFEVLATFFRKQSARAPRSYALWQDLMRLLYAIPGSAKFLPDIKFSDEDKKREQELLRMSDEEIQNCLYAIKKRITENKKDDDVFWLELFYLNKYRHGNVVKNTEEVRNLIKAAPKSALQEPYFADDPTPKDMQSAAYQKTAEPKSHSEDHLDSKHSHQGEKTNDVGSTLNQIQSDVKKNDDELGSVLDEFGSALDEFPTE